MTLPCRAARNSSIYSRSMVHALQAEMRQGLAYFHETIFPSLPVFYRRIDTALKQIGQPMLPIEHNLFRFGSWMGGDRDGAGSATFVRVFIK